MTDAAIRSACEKQAEKYTEALNNLLKSCGYTADAKALTFEELKKIRPDVGNALAGVVCEIGSLDLLGEEVDFEGFYMNLADYGYIHDPEVYIEPFNSCIVGFYRK